MIKYDHISTSTRQEWKMNFSVRIKLNRERYYAGDYHPICPHLRGKTTEKTTPIRRTAVRDTDFFGIMGDN